MQLPAITGLARDADLSRFAQWARIIESTRLDTADRITMLYKAWIVTVSTSNTYLIRCELPTVIN